jgi:hypothetical protein
MNPLPPGGVSPPAGSPARQADALLTIAARLRRDAQCLEALAYELRDDGPAAVVPEVDVERAMYGRRSIVMVRLPRGLHEALKHEAHRREVSLNELCIRKLVKPL